jgi:hypothetical protein
MFEVNESRYFAEKKALAGSVHHISVVANIAGIIPVNFPKYKSR